MEKRVLLVDADPAFAEGVSRDLGRSGITVSVVLDDGGAIDRAKVSRPDAIVLSEMAERNVFAACNRVRRTPGLSDVPVVVISESATPSAIEAHRSSRTPAAAYLRKPLEDGHLLQALRPLFGDGLEADDGEGGIEEIDAADVIDDVEPLDGASDEGGHPGPPPPLEAMPDPLVEAGPEPRLSLGGSPEERVQFLRDRLRARDELVQKGRAAWALREQEMAAQHAHASRLFAALQAQMQGVAERDETIAELERSVLEARREHDVLRQQEAELREQLEDAEGRARSLSEILNDTLQQREEGDRGWSARVAEVEAHANELQTELDGLRAAREQLDEAIESAARELREARDEIDAAAAREEELRRELAELRQVSTDRERHLEEQLRVERERLENELLQVRDELENELAAVRGDLSAQVAELQGELAATRDDAGARSLEVEQQHGIIDDLTTRLDDATRRLEEMDRLAGQRGTRIETAEQEADAARTELLAARARMTDLERDIEMLRAASQEQAEAARRELEEHLRAAQAELEGALAEERAAAEARIAELERTNAEERSRREAEVEDAFQQAAARVAELEGQAAEQVEQARTQGEARLAEVRAATRADSDARLAQVSAAAAARVRTLEEELERREAHHAEELERREARFEQELASARGDASARMAEASGEMDARLEAERARFRDELEELSRRHEHEVRRAREEADEAIAHARAEIEDRLAASETDADDRVATLERRLQEERAEHERELGALRARLEAAAEEAGGFISVDPGAADPAELRSAREQITALEQQVKAAVEQAARFRGDRDRAAAAYEKAREEAVRLRRQQQGGEGAEQLRRELREVRASREKLQDELASQIADLASQLARRDSELLAAKQAGSVATPDLHAALHRIEVLERDHRRLLAEREQRESEFRQQLEQITSAGDAAIISGLRSRVSELQDQLHGGASRERLEQLEAELDELRGENEFLSSEVARYAEKVSQLSAGRTPSAGQPIARIKR